MASRKRALMIGAIVIVVVAAVVIYTRPGAIVLTGIVTTHEVIVSPQVTAQLSKLLVKEGDELTEEVFNRLRRQKIDKVKVFASYAAVDLRDEGEAIERGASWITLEARESNEIAQRLYRKYGFSTIAIRRAYYSDNGENAVVMWAGNLRGELYSRRLQTLATALDAAVAASEKGRGPACPT